MSDTSMAIKTVPATASRQWQRHTLPQRVLRFALTVLVFAAIVQSVRHVELIPEFLLDAHMQMADLLVRMWPPDGRYYMASVHGALIETLHMATLGTLLSLFMAVPLALLVARNVMPHRGVNFLARVVLVTSRSVNSLVWALLFVAIFGPGALAGTLAIACRSVGFVGKLLGEAIEEAPRGPIEALEAAGAGWFASIGYGYWPQCKPAVWSVLLLRWDINVRESAVLGLVGAGGIGMALDAAMNLFQWDQAGTILLAMLAVVVLAEVMVTKLRARVLLP